MSSSYTSYSSSSYSTSSTQDGQSHSSRVTEQSYSSDRDGTHTVRRTEESGQPTYEERTHVPASGQLPAQDNSQGRIQDVTDEDQKKRDEEYLERMEDEYAKREGGA